ncbi:MAG: calcium-binding protein [Gammaproteobacteria bacterium]
MATTGNDVIMGTNGPDNLKGLGGSDTIFGKGGNDTLSSDTGPGAPGNDSLFGGNDNDTLNGNAGNDTLTGGKGDDTFRYSGSEGNDRVTDFHFGEDRVDFRDASSAQIFNVYGNTIEAGDTGVSSVGGDLQINFGPTPFPGFGVLTLDGLGSDSLLVGSDVF